MLFNLENLNLRSNHNSVNNSRIQMKYLKEIDLANNFITWIQKNEYNIGKIIFYLDLSNKKLSYIDSNLSNLIKIKTLKLSCKYKYRYYSKF